ncbi:MAG TPA: divalent metal cation transporter [Acidimicrobiales bacterium]|nr:divalent metal cation transporter [Acidimicrobiales bacterium]
MTDRPAAADATGAADSSRPDKSPAPEAPTTGATGAETQSRPEKAPGPEAPATDAATGADESPRPDKTPEPTAPAAGSAGPARPNESAGRQLQPPATAVLDQAHLGDIEGALGRVSVGDIGERHSWRKRLLTFAAIAGPGLIVMVGDNDAGGVSTYAQAGQNYHTSLLWVLLLLIPVLIVNQEMVVRLGAVTGVGHARLINERFGKGWGWFSVGDLFILNFLTIVTEFIGISLAASYAGISEYVAVPIAAVALVAIMASGSFQRWERAMFVFIAISLVQIPMFFLSHPQWGTIGHNFVVPGVNGGVTSAAVLLIIAIVGTTVAPWQLFFQQSNIVDKRITPRFISYERADTVMGSIVVVIGAVCIMVAADYAARGTPAFGHFTNAAGVAHLLAHHSQALGTLFAILLFDASVLGAAAVTLSTSYAFGDVFGIRHSLHRGFKEAKQFYLSYIAMVVAAAAIVLIPKAPLGLITTSVQALAGLLLPSAAVFLLLLCNDREVLGPWVNPKWLNLLASFIIGVLLVLSGTLMATTLFPGINVIDVFIYITVALAAGGVIISIVLRILARRPGQAVKTQPPTMNQSEKLSWRMPPLALLKPVKWSPGLRVGMLSLRAYLVVAAVLLVVKAVQLGGG